MIYVNGALPFGLLTGLGLHHGLGAVPKTLMGTGVAAGLGTAASA